MHLKPISTAKSTLTDKVLQSCNISYAFDLFFANLF